MELSTTVKERGTVLMAVLTLVFIGISLLASTLQSFHAQEESGQRHLDITSQSILLALESAIYSGSNDIRRDYINRRTNKLFDTLKNNKDIVFAGIIDHQGGQLLTSDSPADSITLPRKILLDLLSTGQWSGEVELGDRLVYVTGKEIFSPNNKYLLLHESPPVPLFLLVGLDTSKLAHLDQEMKQTVLLQSAFICLAAIICWILAILFLSRRKKAKRAEVLEHFQTKLLDNLPDGLLILNNQASIIAANPSASNILQLPYPSLAGREISELPPAIGNAISHSLQTEEQQWKKISVGGKHLELFTLPIRRSTEYPYLTIIRDRTTLYNLEHNLAQAEKLASIGTLAAGIAHEVRNPLSSLRGFAQYFVKKLAGQQPEEEYARTMVLEADRLNRVITDLLFLANPRPVDPQDVNLEQLVDELGVLLKFELQEKHITVDSTFEASTVYADIDALKQCLLNLLLNCIDALDGDQRTITITSYREGDFTCIKVADTGKGMSPEQAAQAFEPFFTNKVRGTGLGLSIVNRTVLDHGGTASIDSAPGNGCAITLSFPNRPLQDTEEV